MKSFGKIQQKVDEAKSVNNTIKDGSNIEFGVIDPRCENLGLRIYSLASNSDNVYSNDQIEITDEDNHDALRYLYGIPQWEEVANNVPGRVNFDLFGSIELTKGCFLGQELTARAHHTGIVRKRPFLAIASSDPVGVSSRLGSGNPLELKNDQFDINLLGKSLKNSKGRKSGSVIGR